VGRWILTIRTYEWMPNVTCSASSWRVAPCQRRPMLSISDCHGPQDHNRRHPPVEADPLARATRVAECPG
jgi:hypothetical protein